MLPHRGPGRSAAGRRRIFGYEKAVEMNVAGINFGSFSAQICIYN